MRSEQEVNQLIEDLHLQAVVFPDGIRDLYELRAIVGHHRFDPLFTQFGIVLGYGDSFAYNGLGYTLVGEDGIGKSSISELFHQRDQSLHLCQDHLVLYDVNHTDNYYICRYNEHLGGNNWEEVVRNYVASFETTSHYPLGTLLHLVYPDNSREGFIEPDLEDTIGTFLYTLDFGQTDLSLKFRGVQVLKYSVPFVEVNDERYVYPDTEKVYQDLRSLSENPKCEVA